MHAALRRAVELGEHEAGDARGLGEDTRLRDRVLARVRVEHQQRLVRRAGALAADHAHDLRELLASAAAFVCRRPAVSMIATSAPRATAAFTVSNATAAGSPPAGPAITSQPARSPQACELLARRRAEGVAGA